MTRAPAVALLAATFLALAPPAAEALSVWPTALVGEAGAELRAEPSPDAPLLRRLPPGAFLWVDPYGPRGGWLWVWVEDGANATAGARLYGYVRPSRLRR